MRLAVVGSREWSDESAIRACLSHLSIGDVVISGACRGADAIAAKIAREMGLDVIEHPADWNAHGKAAGYVRNRLIVDDCDRLVAFWDGHSRGTMHSVGLARTAGKPVRVFGGASIQGENGG